MKKKLIDTLEVIKEFGITLMPIILPILVAVIVFNISNCCSNMNNKVPDTKADTIVTNLKDSIKHLKIKENEEISIIRNASNDSTLIIFKQLVSE